MLGLFCSSEEIDIPKDYGLRVAEQSSQADFPRSALPLADPAELQ